jgi:hypothetical protein
MSMSRSDLFRSDPVLTAVSRWRVLQLNLNDADDLILKVRPDIVVLPTDLKPFVKEVDGSAPPHPALAQTLSGDTQLFRTTHARMHACTGAL